MNKYKRYKSLRERSYFKISFHSFFFGAFNKFQGSFCTAIQNCRRLLTIQYIIAINLMR